MCGIVLLHGPNARERLAGCLERLRHRGPDDIGTWVGGDFALGFTRLAINGSVADGRQPLQTNELVGVVNGEVYNHRELAQQIGIPPPPCDAHVVLPLLEKTGPPAIDLIDGFYSAVALSPATHVVTTLRDHMGKKPLFVGRSGTELFITSELKAMPRIDWFEIAPRGVARIDVPSGRITQVRDHRLDSPQQELPELLREAVRKRMPQANQPVGVFLSGGLDSSIIAALTSRVRSDVTYFTLGMDDSPDLLAAQTVASELGLRDLRVTPVPSDAQMPALIDAVVHATESHNPSIVSNGVATYLLANAARAAGLKIVLTGEGADELFGGYHLFDTEDTWREVRAQLIDDMHFTELRRLDMSCMAHSIEARCPFLDRSVRASSDQLEFHDLYGEGRNKTLLRRSFEGLLPPEVLHRQKTSLDVGSGVRRAVVQHLRRDGRSERDELRDLWRRHFEHDESNPHFHSYPVFDAAIDRRGIAHR